jgi:adenylate kinase
MIILFGPSGVGKSTQGQMLADLKGWRWLSMSQLLRDSGDIGLKKVMQAGELVSSYKINEIIADAFNHVSDTSKIVLDGYPRKLDQAKWLIDNHQSIHSDTIDLVVIIEVHKSELIKRLKLRGRADDTLKAINKRISIYKQETDPILKYFAEQDIKIVHIDGLGTIKQVHTKVMDKLIACKLEQI